LQRDIEAIRSEFGIEIAYNRKLKGYFIDEEKSLNYDSFVKFLEIVGTAEILSESIKEGNDILQFISFESESKLQGIEQLRMIIDATKTKRIIEFSHENFDTQMVTQIKLFPYHIKEYQHRWYIYGCIADTDVYRTFAIDRITQLKILTKTFKIDKKVDARAKFSEVVGLTYSEAELQEVIIKVESKQYKYLKSLPLHHSQELYSKTDGEVILKYWLRPNYELTQRLLMLGSTVRVMKPASLVKEIKWILKETIAKYK
jgi:predicted DNA-binding transcriptional regulator YafY